MQVVHEKNDLMRALLQEWLGDAGSRVRVRANTTRDVRDADAVDLVVVSVYMPKQSGARPV
jgi:DNA-binding response OmpR family regulator